MGIQGLLPYLKKVSREVNIRDFKGCTVAIDTYCWLHRGAFACAEKLALGEKTDQYVYYCMKYVNYLLSVGIKPIMVFDGCHLPSKKEVEKTRRERRDVHRKKAAQFLREGKRSEARDCLTKCIDITPQMALELMNACRDKGVDCIVAPYEADAQLAYLNKIGVAQIIISEDSDLILFGCEKVMFKMDHAGNGILIEQRHLNVAMDLRPDSYTFDKFRYMCILSGCDYLASLSGIGLAKANKVFKITKQTDMSVVVKKLPSTLNMNSLVVPSEYVAGFHKANNTFLYQLVYDPIKRRLLPLNPYPPELDPEDLQYAGPHIDQDKALQIALGNIDIYTGQQIANFNPEAHQPKSQKWDKNRDGTQLSHMRSIWDRLYRPMSNISQHADANTNKHSTKGQEVTISVPKVLKKIIPKRPREEEEVSTKDLLSSYSNIDEAHNPEKRSKAIADVSDVLPYNLEHVEQTRSSQEHVEKIHSNISSDLPNLTVTAARRHSTPYKLENTRISGSPDHKSSADSKRSPLLSPNSKNKFSLSNQMQSKNRFDLNACKQKEDVKVEVKSRFFKAKKPMRPTDFFGKLNQSHELVEKGSDDERSDSSDSETELEDSKDHVLFTSMNQASKTSESHQTSSQNEQKSPYGSFGFSKKVGTSFLDKFQRTTDKLSPGISKQFKPVIPQNGCMDTIKSTVHKSELNSCVQETNRVFLADSKSDYGLTPEVVSPSASQHSNLYSIDSYSQLDLDLMDNSQRNSQEPQNSSPDVSTDQGHTNNAEGSSYVDTMDNQDSAPESIGSSYFSGSNNSAINKKSGLSGTQKLKGLSSFYRSCSAAASVAAVSSTPHTGTSVARSNNSSQATPSKSQGSTKSMGGVRTSGLSKSIRKVSSKSKPCNENQPAILNFFGKSCAEKMSKSSSEASSMKPLSPHKDNVINTVLDHSHDKHSHEDMNNSVVEDWVSYDKRSRSAQLK